MMLRERERSGRMYYVVRYNAAILWISYQLRMVLSLTLIRISMKVIFSPDSRLLAFHSSDRTVRLWDTATRTLYQPLEGHFDQVRSVIFSPDSRLLASRSSDHTVRLWDTATGTLQHTLEGHSDQVRSVTFSPDSQLLASSHSSDRTVWLWNTATGVL
ncbi:hypothetical protein ACN38_g4387 [Penicillium nordicum]|uniref:Uncharacterized protein n=1 Tax=Penicillium nordicum TaxID=229535 RepID=A0A0M9WH51_9EURO|nr:hypothetical protein ACN38_g4387 [Penicillium nordicum]